MDEILKLLGIDRLDESAMSDIKQKLTDIVEMKARERSTVYLKEEKSKLLNEYEEKFEDYKKDITGKFSNFVDSVLEEELEIPEKVVRYAKVGEMYSDLIEQFKIKLAIDEGVLNEEVKDLLREAKDEILSLKAQVNSLTSKNMTLMEDAKQMAAHIYLRKKCDGLTEAKKEYILKLLEDVTDAKEIDRKFSYAVRMSEAFELGAEADEAGDNFDCTCPTCGYFTSSKVACSTVACPKCGAQMVESEDAIVPADEAGQGSMEVTAGAEEEKAISEAFEEQKKRWKLILKENKI